MSIATRIDLAWAAGLFEGEGCVTASIRNDRTLARLAVSSTDRDVLEKFHAIVQVGSVNGPYRKPSKAHKPIYVWSACGYDALKKLYKFFGPLLCSRRKARFEKALSQEPPPYIAGASNRCRPMARRLTRQQVLDIRKSSDPERSLALRFGLSQTSIGQIRHKRSYKDV